MILLIILLFEECEHRWSPGEHDRWCVLPAIDFVYWEPCLFFLRPLLGQGGLGLGLGFDSLSFDHGLRLDFLVLDLGSLVVGLKVFIHSRECAGAFIELLSDILKEVSFVSRLGSCVVHVVDDEPILDRIQVHTLLRVRPDLVWRLVGGHDEELVLKWDGATLDFTSAAIFIGPNFDSTSHGLQRQTLVCIIHEDNRLISIAIPPFVLAL